jgi:putative membrane protein
MKEYKIKFNSKNYSPKEKGFWAKVLIMALAIFLTCVFFPSIVKADPVGALLAAIVISLLNAFLRPVLMMIAMPLILGTFGFFYLIINAVIILITDRIIPSFEVNGFWGAIGFIIIVSIISWLLELPARLNKRNATEEEQKNPEFTSYEDVTEEKENKEEKEN